MGGTTTTTKAADPAATKAARDLAALTTKHDKAVADLATVSSERDKAVADLATMSSERDQARSDLQALTTAHEATLKDLGTITAERDKAVADLATATTGLTKAKADLRAAKASAKPKSVKARAIAPLKDAEPRGEDLLTLIGAAETVELVFSDGKREVTALAPQLIEGEAWYQAANGVRLRVPSLLIHGPGRDDQALKVAGYGLVLDGELTAYSSRIDVLTILPGSQHELKDDVIFG